MNHKILITALVTFAATAGRVHATEAKTANLSTIASMNTLEAMGSAGAALSGSMGFIDANPAAFSLAGGQELLIGYAGGPNDDYNDADVKAIRFSFPLPLLKGFWFGYGRYSRDKVGYLILSHNGRRSSMLATQVNDHITEIGWASMWKNWLRFGAAYKYISGPKEADHVNAGVQIQTPWLNGSGEANEGLCLGISYTDIGAESEPAHTQISVFDNSDLVPDAIPDSTISYQVGHQWPTVLRIGISVVPTKVFNHKLCVAADAVHPENTPEHVNVGAMMLSPLHKWGAYYFSLGYRGLGWSDGENWYGFTFGAGVSTRIGRRLSLKTGYSFSQIEKYNTVRHFMSVGLAIDRSRE